MKRARYPIELEAAQRRRAQQHSNPKDIVFASHLLGPGQQLRPPDTRRGGMVEIKGEGLTGRHVAKLLFFG